MLNLTRLLSRTAPTASQKKTTELRGRSHARPKSILNFTALAVPTLSVVTVLVCFFSHSSFAQTNPIVKSADQEADPKSEVTATPEDNLCPASLIHLGNGAYFSNHALIVNKKKRTLTVWKNHDGKLEKIKEYASDMGKKDGVKVSKGDYKTPEGIYFFQQMLEGAGLDFRNYGKRAFTTNYPNMFDSRDGKTGNGIWLHAIPETETLQRGSKGCVVLRNDSILDVSQFIQLHTTPFVIFDDVPMVSVDQQEKKYKEYADFFEKWRNNWESKQLDSYMEAYSDTFETNGMNKAKWREFKKSLADRYEKIRIQFSEPMIVEYKDQVIIRSLQRYSSDQKEDFGEKDLYIKLENGQPKIIGENWIAVTDPKAQAELPPTQAAVANANKLAP